MPLTYDERLELLKKAREAKKAKRDAKTIAPEPEPIPEHVPEPIPEPIPEPVKPTTKKNAIKRLKKTTTCCKPVKIEGEMSKEEYLITDEEPAPAAAPIAATINAVNIIRYIFFFKKAKFSNIILPKKINNI